MAATSAIGSRFLGINFYRPVPRGIELFIGRRRHYLSRASVLRRRLLYSYHRQTRNAWAPYPSPPKLLVLYSADKRGIEICDCFLEPFFKLNRRLPIKFFTRN